MISSNIILVYVAMFLIIRAFISFVHFQICSNRQYVAAFAANGLLFWLVRYARGGANLIYLEGIPMVRPVIRAISWYWDKVIHMSLHAGAITGTTLGSLAEKICGTEGLGAAISMMMYMAPVCFIPTVLLYLFLFPAAYLALLQDRKEWNLTVARQ